MSTGNMRSGVKRRRTTKKAPFPSFMHHPLLFSLLAALVYIPNFETGKKLPAESSSTGGIQIMFTQFVRFISLPFGSTLSGGKHPTVSILSVQVLRVRMPSWRIVPILLQTYGQSQAGPCLLPEFTIHFSLNVFQLRSMQCSV